VYRLIAVNTADVFLNNNSFDKGAIMTAFAHSSEAIRKFSPLLFIEYHGDFTFL